MKYYRSVKTKYQKEIGYINLKEYDRAIDAFKLIPENSDWNDNAMYRIAWTLYKKEEYKKAIDGFFALQKKHPATILLPHAIFGMGNCYFKLGQYAEAIKKYQDVVQNSPNVKTTIEEPGEEKITDLREEAQYRIAESYYNLQMHQQAINNYQKLITLYPASEWADDAQDGIASAYLQMGNKKLALEAHRMLLQKYPQSDLAPSVQLELANYYYESENYSTAIAEYQKVIDQYSRATNEAVLSAVWRAQYYIGLSYYKLQSYQQAIDAFQKVDKRSEFASRAAYYIGWCWFDKENPKRDFKQAIKAFEQVIEQFPGSSESRRAMLAIGDCYSQLVQWQKAVNVYIRLIKAYPDSKDAQQAQLLIGHAYRRLTKYREAINAYKKITDDKTDRYPTRMTVEALSYMGESLFELEEYEEAARIYLRVGLVYSEFDPLNALNALIRAGTSYEKLQRWYDAKTWYEKALKEYQNHSKKTAEWKPFLDYAQTHLQLVQKQINE